jgi:DNA primase
MDKAPMFDEDFLMKVREQSDLPRLVASVVKLRRAGKSFVGRCPFHEEKTGSFNVDPVRNTYKCYGCPAAGDAIAWMMAQHRMTFPEAVTSLAASAGLEIPAKNDSYINDPDRRRQLARLYRVLERAQLAYQRGLSSLTSSREYLQRRGIETETINRFGLGAVASGVLQQLRGFTPDELVGAGVACEREGAAGLYDRFRSRVIFPIYNAKGNLVSFAGRSLIEKPDRTPKYINGPDTELFSKGRVLYGLFQARDSIRKSRTAVVVEGYIDVLQAHQAGDCRVVGTMGTAVTEQQLVRLFREADLVVFAFDGDKPGRRAALRAAAELLSVMRDGQQAKFLFLPAGDDPDSFIRQQGIESWRASVDGAQQLSQYLGDYISHRLDRSIPESQVAAVGKARAVLEKIKHALVFRLALRLRFEEIIGIPLE